MTRNTQRIRGKKHKREKKPKDEDGPIKEKMTRLKINQEERRRFSLVQNFSI